MSVMKAIALANEEFATAASSTGAPYHDESQTWHDINWRQVNRNVRRLQARIVKATQEGRWGKVKALQHLLTRSFSGKALAVRRVTENKGKRTPGVDKQVWSTPASKRQAVKTLRQHGYRAQPLKRVYIPKKNGKGRRALSIPTMKDRAMQALYRLALDPIAETTGDPNSYGYRKGRAPVDALQQCWTCLNRKCSARWILEADIKDCFDAISHEWLEQHIPLEKRILYQWLKAGYMGKSVLRATEAGVPQGGIISPVIANMTLDGLEAELRAAIPPIPNKYEGTKPKVNLVRFADNFVITGCSKELLENRVKPVIEQFPRDRELRLSPDKTRTTHIDEGFDFLGQNIRKYNGKLLIKPAANNVSAFLDKVRTTIKANRQVPPGWLILLLNPIIRGWANYHRHAARPAWRPLFALIMKSFGLSGGGRDVDTHASRHSGRRIDTF